MTRTADRATVAVSWVAVCIVAAGGLTYGYLALVARALPEAGYGAFGAYWSAALVVGFGGFLPVELELARSLQARGPAGLPPGTGRTLLAVVTLSGAVVALATPALGRDAPGLLLPLLVLCPVSAVQFLTRGTLLGTGRLRTHGVVLLADAALRVAGAAEVAALAGAPGAGSFAWTLVVAIALAHTPVLLWLRPWRSRAAGGSPRPFATAVGHLLVSTLCAQVLLNGAPLLVAGVAGPDQQDLVGRFVAAFTLVRLPLFVAVPLQSALVPVLTRTLAAGEPAALRRLVLRICAGIGAVAVVAAVLGLAVGPAATSLLFGARYALDRGDLALLAVGAALHLGLLVLSQVLVATARHRAVAAVWLVGLGGAALLFLAGPGLVTAAASAFTGGSGVALGTAVVLLLRAGPPAARAAVPEEGDRGRVG